MKSICLVLGICAIVALAGCANFGETKVSMPYEMKVDRTDQVIDGNRGYLQGTPPAPEDMTGRKRSYLAVNVDLPRSSKEMGVPETKLTGPCAAKSSTSCSSGSGYVSMEEEVIK